MIDSNPRALLFLALGLLLFGWLMPFLMVLRLLESTFFLNFLSWGASVSGFYLGIVAVAGLVRKRKK
ncbi:MAG: hypothetical protein ACOYYU_17540 [Chloroflexota bacterium]